MKRKWAIGVVVLALSAALVLRLRARADRVSDENVKEKEGYTATNEAVAEEPIDPGKCCALKSESITTNDVLIQKCAQVCPYGSQKAKLKSGCLRQCSRKRDVFGRKFAFLPPCRSWCVTCNAGDDDGDVKKVYISRQQTFKQHLATAASVGVGAAALGTLPVTAPFILGGAVTVGVGAVLVAGDNIKPVGAPTAVCAKVEIFQGNKLSPQVSSKGSHRDLFLEFRPLEALRWLIPGKDVQKASKDHAWGSKERRTNRGATRHAIQTALKHKEICGALGAQRVVSYGRMEKETDKENCLA